jgi:glycosyltransferase involved in cell wall biosynthesis
MLVNNDWKIDSRVRKEATALAAAGHEVHVIFRAGEQVDATEQSEGVTYHSVPMNSPDPYKKQLRQLLRLHFGVVLSSWRAAGARRVGFKAAGVALAAVLAALAALALLLALAPVLALALLVIFGLRKAGRPQPAERLLALRDRVLARARGEFEVRAGRLYGQEWLHYMNRFGIDAQPIARAIAPTVVHSHDLSTLSTGYAVAREARCPLLYDAHELETHTNYWSLAAATKKWIAIYEAVLIRRTRAVVTVCDSIADWLKDNYGIHRPTVVLNSPDLQAVQRGPHRTVRDALGLSADTPLAVYVGSVTIDRGTTQCVQAAALVPGLHFAFVGPRYSVTEAEILATAEQLGIRDRVHLVDPVPSREVTTFVSSADCSVIAIQNVCLSYYFCFPNKLLESVVSGVPVAVGRLVELERFVNKFHVGEIMDETDPASIAQAIRKIVEQPARYRPSTQVLQVIRDEYGWQAQQRRLGTLYGALA